MYLKNPANLRLMAPFPISVNWMSGIAMKNARLLVGP
nr:MAG TPA: hypothetical protein [Caudoviricetes sp.]